MATITYVVDPLNILTMGLISGDPLNLITDGFVTAIIEEEIIEGVGSGDFGQPWDAWSNQKDRKKKKKIIPIRRKPIKIDVRKVKSKRGNARNNIKAGLTKKIPNGENIIQVINEQIEVTRKTRKVSRPAPVRSVIQLVRPRPSVPVREVRPATRIAGQPIRRPAPPALGVPSAPVRTSRPQVASAPVRTSRPQVASAPVRTRSTRRQGGGRY